MNRCLLYGKQSTLGRRKREGSYRRETKGHVKDAGDGLAAWRLAEESPGRPSVTSSGQFDGCVGSVAARKKIENTDSACTVGVAVREGGQWV